MSKDFELIELQFESDALKKLANRKRNQLVGCMHAHNELSVLNRLLMFSLNDVGEGQLHDDAYGVQMWCIMQVLTGKLFETWSMLCERVLRSNPEDPVVVGLSAQHKKSLAWLKSYFGFEEDRPKETALRTIRDKTAFHYDKMSLDHAINDIAKAENRIYLAQHPVNALYYAGSALVFRSVFAMIADKATDTKGMTHSARVTKGVQITQADVKEANVHLHNVLYGLIKGLLEMAFGRPTEEVEQIRHRVLDAPQFAKVALPMFIDVGPEKGAS